MKPRHRSAPRSLRGSQPLLSFEMQGMSVELHCNDRAHSALFTVGLADLAAAGVERVVIIEGGEGADDRWWTALISVEGQRLVVSTLEDYSSRHGSLFVLGHTLSDRLRRLSLSLVP